VASVKGDPVISFYATTPELFEWIRDWVKRYRLHAVFASQFPRYKSFYEVAWDDPAAAKKVIAAHTDLVLDLTPFPPDVSHVNALHSANWHRLDIGLPQRTARGMEPGSIGFVTRQSRHLKIWRAIVQAMIECTQTGLWLHGPRGRSRPPDGHLRYTPGVVAAVEKGMKLLGGGHTWFELMTPRERSAWLARQAKVPVVRRHIEPGDAVLWWKPLAGGSKVVPIRATVEEITAQRVRISCARPDREGTETHLVHAVRLQRCEKRAERTALAPVSKSRAGRQGAPLVKPGPAESR
jgi:hypothetical protein